MPRPHHGGGDPPDDAAPPPHESGGAGPPEEPPHRRTGAGPDPGGVAGGERAVAHAFQRGRPSTGGGAETPRRSGPPHADDIQLSRWEHAYDQLGAEPPTFNVEANDAAHGTDGAHTKDNHGPQIPLRRTAAGVRTIEGRIYGDRGWDRPQNGSLKWDDPSTMNRTINDYVRHNWEKIRNDLAMGVKHRAVFDAHHRVGEGFVNKNMGGLGPREAQYATTSVVRIIIAVVPGSDPPEPFIMTTFPSALG